MCVYTVKHLACRRHRRWFLQEQHLLLLVYDPSLNESRLFNSGSGLQSCSVCKFDSILCEYVSRPVCPFTQVELILLSFTYNFAVPTLWAGWQCFVLWWVFIRRVDDVWFLLWYSTLRSASQERGATVAGCALRYVCSHILNRLTHRLDCETTNSISARRIAGCRWKSQRAGGGMGEGRADNMPLLHVYSSKLFIHKPVAAAASHSCYSQLASNLSRA